MFSLARFGRAAATATAATAVAAALGAAATVSAASAGTAAAGGVIHLYETGNASNIGHDIVTGAFTDHGLDHEGALGHGTVNKIVLGKGSFEVNVKPLFVKIKIVSANQKSCSLVVSSVASLPVSHGTGAYRGIRGSLRVTFLNALILPKLRDGKCASYPGSAAPRADVYWATGSGRVSL